MQNHPLNKERLMTLDIVSIFTKNFNWSRNVSGSLYLDQVEKQCLELLTNNDFFIGSILTKESNLFAKGRALHIVPDT